ncbi:recombinase family protein [Chitinophaga lutea]
MKSAYLYVRVSTDEQKRKGYSLVEQEDRLIRHCELNGIQVKGIYREDDSAKDFNRPEWKKLIKKLRKNTIDQLKYPVHKMGPIQQEH